MDKPPLIIRYGGIVELLEAAAESIRPKLASPPTALRIHLRYPKCSQLPEVMMEFSVSINGSAAS